MRKGERSTGTGLTFGAGTPVPPALTFLYSVKRAVKENSSIHQGFMDSDIQRRHPGFSAFETVKTDDRGIC